MGSEQSLPQGQLRRPLKLLSAVLTFQKSTAYYLVSIQVIMCPCSKFCNLTYLAGLETVFPVMTPVDPHIRAGKKILYILCSKSISYLVIPCLLLRTTLYLPSRSCQYIQGWEMIMPEQGNSAAQ